MVCRACCCRSSSRRGRMRAWRAARAIHPLVSDPARRLLRACGVHLPFRHGRPHAEVINFMKNLTIAGGFLVLAGAGPGALALDRPLPLAEAGSAPIRPRGGVFTLRRCSHTSPPKPRGAAPRQAIQELAAWATKSPSSAPPAMSAAKCSTSSPSASFPLTKCSRSPRAGRRARGVVRRPNAQMPGSRNLRFHRHRYRADVGRRRGRPRNGRRASPRKAASSSTIPRTSAMTRTCRWSCPRSTPRRSTASARRTSSPIPTARPRSWWWR